MPWHEAVESLGDWLESESNAQMRFRNQMKRMVAGLLGATLILGVAVTVALFQLGSQVTLNRRVLKAVCNSQGHTIAAQRQSLRTSVPLFKRLIPPDKLRAAVAQSQQRINQLERDLAELRPSCIAGGSRISSRPPP